MRNRDLLQRRVELVEKLVMIAVEEVGTGLQDWAQEDQDEAIGDLRARFFQLLASRWQT